MACCGITRRGFLLGAGTGLAAGVPLTWLGLQQLPDWIDPNCHCPKFSGRSVEVKKPAFAMPGRFPGRVVEMHHPDSVSDDTIIGAQPVKQMMARGMCELTGADHP